MQKQQWKWWSSFDEERFNGPFDTREEAIEDLEGEPGFVAEAIKPDIKISQYVTDFEISRLIEDASERIDEDWADPEGDVIEIGGSRHDFERRIRKAIDEWQLANRVHVEAFMFADIRNQEDVNV